MQNTIIIFTAVSLLAGLLLFERRNQPMPRLALKCLLSALFCIAALVQFHLAATYSGLIIAGLFMCLIGDLGLGLQTRQGLNIGLAAFLGGHLLYTAAFFSVSPPNVWTWGTLGAAAAVSAAFYSWLRPHLNRMNRPVAVYVIVITLMLGAAGTVMGSPALAYKGRLMAFCGALCFYLSDIFVARQRFVTPLFSNRALGLPLYYTGQFLLAFSVAHLELDTMPVLIFESIQRIIGGSGSKSSISIEIGRQMVMTINGFRRYRPRSRGLARGRLGAGAVLALLMVFGFAVDAPAAPVEPIVVGMSAAFSGPTRSLGIELYRGSAAYIDDINRQGGINGRPVVIKAYDDGYNPLPALENTLRLINDDQVFVLFNYVGTPTVTRILPLLKKFSTRHIYLLFPFTGAQPQRSYPYNEFVFNLRASYRQETQGLVDHLLAINRKRIAVFYQADAYGRSGWEGVRRALVSQNLKMVSEATYRRGTPFIADMQRQVEILRATQPDAIVSIGSSAACAAFIRDARDAGWQIPIANLSFVDSVHLTHMLVKAQAATGTEYTANLINSQVVPSHENLALHAVREYRRLMIGLDIKLPPLIGASDYVPKRFSAVSFEGFLNAKVLVEMLRRMQGRLDRNRIKAVMQQMDDYDIGIDTPVRFGPHKNQGLDSIYYTTVTQNRCIPLLNWRKWEQ